MADSTAKLSLLIGADQAEFLKVMMGVEQHIERTRQRIAAQNKMSGGGIAGGIFGDAGGISALTGKLAGLASGIASAGAAWQTLKMADELADGIELAEFRMKNFTGSAIQAEAVIAGINDIIRGTPLQFEEMEKSARRLMAVGLGVNETRERLEQIARISVARGGSAEGLAETYAKIHQRGSFGDREMMMLVQEGIGLKDIAEALGKTTEQLQEELENGRLSAEAVQKALEHLGGSAGRYAKVLDEAADLDGGMPAKRAEHKRLMGEAGKRGGFDIVDLPESIGMVLQVGFSSIAASMMNDFRGSIDPLLSLTPIADSLMAAYNAIPNRAMANGSGYDFGNVSNSTALNPELSKDGIDQQRRKFQQEAAARLEAAKAIQKRREYDLQLAGRMREVDTLVNAGIGDPDRLRKLSPLYSEFEKILKYIRETVPRAEAFSDFLKLAPDNIVSQMSGLTNAQINDKWRHNLRPLAERVLDFQSRELPLPGLSERGTQAAESSISRAIANAMGSDRNKNVEDVLKDMKKQDDTRNKKLDDIEKELRRIATPKPASIP